MNIFIILPGHLFENVENLKNMDIIYIVEEYIDDKLDNPIRIKYFRDCLYFYYHYLKKEFRNKNIKYMDSLDKIKLKNTDIVTFYDPVNHDIEKRLIKLYHKYHCNFTMIETHGFITSKDDLIKYYKKKKTLRQTSFYQYQRMKLQILLNNQGKPLGDKLTYDDENRNPMNEHDNIINKKNELFPTNFNDSKKWLKEFIHKRLNKFGEYQDAIIAGHHNIFLYHSGISPMMNIGLLTPTNVVNEIIKHFNKMDLSKKKSELHNIEGFIRQVIGWREHCRLTYVVAYNKMKSANKLKGKYKIPKSWFSDKPNTGIEPLDDALSNGWKYGYLHHIERLMIVGSFMLMIGIHPDEAYKWFFHMSCDSYDWNMINNVKIMALYAYPKLYTTKPYIASSNYILRMSNYKKDGVWDKVWDSLYWEFVNKNKLLIKGNPRLSIQIKNYHNKSNEEKQLYKKTKNDIINKLF
jgi:deoxyribodipyrimidine photolyase-related protein